MRPNGEGRSGLACSWCWNGFELTARASIGRDVGSQDARERAARWTRAEFGRRFHRATAVTPSLSEPRTLAGTDLASIGLAERRARDTLRALAPLYATEISTFRGASSIPMAFLVRLRELPRHRCMDGTIRRDARARKPDAFPFEGQDLKRALGLNDPGGLESAHREVAAVAGLCGHVSVERRRDDCRALRWARINAWSSSQAQRVVEFRKRDSSHLRLPIQPTSPLWGGQRNALAFFRVGVAADPWRGQHPHPKFASLRSQISTSPQRGGKDQSDALQMQRQPGSR